MMFCSIPSVTQWVQEGRDPQDPELSSLPHHPRGDASGWWAEFLRLLENQLP